jgi:diaminohydroxyphosphoribosylaminopyrimidine deaminase/5-amino-6-(5-phosphoribosylamino)uracil reductase
VSNVDFSSGLTTARETENIVPADVQLRLRLAEAILDEHCTEYARVVPRLAGGMAHAPASVRPSPAVPVRYRRTSPILQKNPTPAPFAVGSAIPESHRHLFAPAQPCRAGGEHRDGCRMKFSAADIRWMRRALALARRGLGATSPNPAVGAVLVKAGRVIAQDYHKRAGGPHAEVFVLRKAGRRARGATLYVTMEPCSTWGKTPPCTDAIIAARVKRVVVAALDPNPKHNGRGLAVLRRAGLRVEAGLLADEARALNVAFNKWITTGLPLVTAKAALSLDGKMATHTGDSKWITDAAARRKAHELRAQMDAIMVGANTVIRDNPRLTLRHGVRGRQPWRVVVDSRGRSPRNARLFTDALRHRTIVLTTKLSAAGWRRELARRGVTVLVMPAKRGRVDLRAALRKLGRMEVTSLMVEGGPTLLEAMFDVRLVDRIAFFYAPIIIAGAAKVSQAQRVSAEPWLLEATLAR